MSSNRVYTAAELAAIRRRIRITLGDGRLLGPKHMQARADGCVEAILMDLPQGLRVDAILIDRVPLDLDGMPFLTSGGALRITITPASLGLVKVSKSRFRSLN